MKLSTNHRSKARLSGRHFQRSGSGSAPDIRRALARAKDHVRSEFATLAGENARLLRLALNEAEAIAWQTDYPHLFFPALAAEKVRAVSQWHQRQRALNARRQEWALAE